MVKKIINVPEGILYLEQFQGLESMFPPGSFFLDKKFTGCGATTMFLADSVPTILCSARKELMYSKARSKRFKGKVHLFRDEGDKASPLELMNRMMEYINSCSSPWNTMPPKIIVTYDSFKHVLQALTENGCMDRFRIIVDEAQTLFTDASFKGDVEIEFLENLKHCNNVIFLSATQYMDKYLSAIPFLNGLPYVELQWPESAIHATNIERKAYHFSPQITARDIINKFREDKYFAAKIVNGQTMYSNEIVFFLNDVSLIIKIVQDNDLKPDETNIICADTDYNIRRLDRIGFKIGHAPQDGEPHKTFTFATKCAFEGVDFNSTCAYTVIFSDCKRENLSLDISLDLPQCMGRQRLGCNVFRYDATFYYRSNFDFSEEAYNEFMSNVADKSSLTDEIIYGFSQMSDRMKKNYAAKNRKSESDSLDYATVIDDRCTGSLQLVFNHLAKQNEIRAWDVQKDQYANGCQVMRAIDDSTRPVTDDPAISWFLTRLTKDFDANLKLYCEFLSVNPQYKETLEFLPQIPIKIKEYYNSYGPNTLRSWDYRESNFYKRSLDNPFVFEEVKKMVETAFVFGEFYTLKQTKQMLQKIYDSLNVADTAKAKDLEKFVRCEAGKQTIPGGTRENGYRIC